MTWYLQRRKIRLIRLEGEEMARFTQRKKMNAHNLRIRELPIVTTSEVSHMMGLKLELELSSPRCQVQ